MKKKSKKHLVFCIINKRKVIDVNKRNLKNKTIIGLDIGNGLIKISMLEKTDDLYFLRQHDIFPANNIVNNYKITNYEFLKAKIKEFVEKNHLRNFIFAVSVPNSLACSITRIVEIEKVNRNELKNAVEIELEEKIPVPKEQYIYSYKILSEKNNKQNICIATVMKDYYQQIKKLFAELKYPFVLLPSFLAYVNTYNSVGNSDTNMVLNIGMQHTEIYVFSDSLIYVKSIEYGIKNILESIQNKIQCSQEESQKILQEIELLTIDDLTTNNEIKKDVFNSLANIIQEIQRTIFILRDNFSLQLNNIYLTGGGSKIKFIHEYFTQTTGIPCQPYIPVYMDKYLVPDDIRQANEFVIAASGITMWIEDNTDLIFQEKIPHVLNPQDIFKKLAFSLMGTFLIIHLGFYTAVTINNKRVQNIQKQINVLQPQYEKLQQEIQRYDMMISSAEKKINEYNSIKSQLEAIRLGEKNCKKYLDIIESKTPTTIQIDKIIYDSNAQKIGIYGQSPTFKDLGYYVKELENVNIFREVKFNYKENDWQKGDIILKTISFEIFVKIR